MGLYQLRKVVEEYIIVKNEQNPVCIAKQINNCLDNKDEVMKLYKTWKKEHDVLSKKSVEEFLNM